MFEDLFIAVTIIAIAFLMYKWFELIVLKKERLNIVSRLEGEHLLEYAKRLPIGVESGGVSQEVKNSHVAHPVGKVLRWGLFCVGIGVGIITAFACLKNTEYILGGDYYRENIRNFVIAGWILLCGGVSLVISFIIEYFLCKREE